MSDAIEARLKDLGYTLPVAAAPAANYVPFTISGNLLYISGQLPMESGKVAVTGHVGRDVDVPTAQRAAELCAINILAQIKAALNGDLSKVRRVLKLNGFVASVPEFTEQHLVINGASNLIANVFGDAGKHARAAVGMASLPFNAAVEIDAILEIDV
ncbi:RidA family protein [Agrobacterium rosae]|uniref:RidA family protein n=1 Tax=Agrobacterium rosae TaxID=1972867 RepID=A0AAE5RZ73_9HYPH|nr:RidA family protein [Agrobacterium rosae]KAA3512054.1 RidA family protein [Agrobacterium rosae]KAA3520497.1 RidA family protein [Agrobacterium rosae]MCM2432408.1 RidA family protein [Agrobacterium rosae]MDX8331225.1 RidA family protein [Agrobacterium rosae]MQB48638.1 RidA family protein [Agrobacterium rosae]